LLLAETALFMPMIEYGYGLGADGFFYIDLGRRWLETGQWYLPHQFEPHTVTNMVDNVYPPTALPLFVAGAIAPWPLWWIVPIAVLGYCIWRWQPSPWAWVAIVLLLMWPRSIGGYLYGNTTMWTTAALAAGLMWGWPVALLAIKPSVVLFGVFALGRRSAWIGGITFLAATIVMLPLWLDYLNVLRQTTDTVWHVALFEIPAMLIPVIAWLGSQRWVVRAVDQPVVTAPP
jgi:hypothetical protein